MERKTKKTRTIVVVGSYNTDMVVKAARIPRPGETVLGGDFFMAPGGKGANQAVAAARAGGNVQLIARVGEDGFGEQAIEGFLRDGIGVKHIIKDAVRPSGVALIMVDPRGENSIAVASGANAALSPDDIGRTARIISRADVLLLQLETPLEAVRCAAEIASRHGLLIILNPAPAQSLDDDLLRLVSILTPNENEAETLTGIRILDARGSARAADVLLSRGVKAVCITLGAKGCYLASEGCRGLVPAFDVVAADATAAGDVFNGALAVARAERKPLPEAVRFASAAAAISITRIGAQPSAPSRREILRFLRRRCPDPISHLEAVESDWREMPLRHIISPRNRGDDED